MAKNPRKLRPLLFALTTIMFLLSVAGFITSIGVALSGHVDYRTFYTAGYMVRTGLGSAIYDHDTTKAFQDRLVGPAETVLPFNHLAYESLLHVPLSLLSYRGAYVAFLLLNLSVLAAVAWKAPNYLLKAEGIWPIHPGIFALSFLPVGVALIEGQDSILLLAFFLLAYHAIQNGQEFTAGIFVGLTLFKFQYALPIAVLYLLWRRFRFLKGFVCSAAVVIAVSVWILGARGIESYVHYLPGAGVRFSATNDVLLSIQTQGMPNFRGLFYMLTGGSTTITNFLTVLFSGAALLYAARWAVSLPGALLMAMLVSYHQMISDTTLLIIPLGVAANHFFRAGAPPRRYLGPLILFAFVSPSVLLFMGTRFYLEVVPILLLFACFGELLKAPPRIDDGRSKKRPQTETIGTA